MNEFDIYHLGFFIYFKNNLEIKLVKNYVDFFSVDIVNEYVSIPLSKLNNGNVDIIKNILVSASFNKFNDKIYVCFRPSSAGIKHTNDNGAEIIDYLINKYGCTYKLDKLSKYEISRKINKHELLTRNFVLEKKTTKCYSAKDNYNAILGLEENEYSKIINELKDHLSANPFSLTKKDNVPKYYLNYNRKELTLLECSYLNKLEEYKIIDDFFILFDNDDKNILFYKNSEKIDHIFYMMNIYLKCVNTKFFKKCDNCEEIISGRYKLRCKHSYCKQCYREIFVLGSIRGKVSCLVSANCNIEKKDTILLDSIDVFITLTNLLKYHLTHHTKIVECDDSLCNGSLLVYTNKTVKKYFTFCDVCEKKKCINCHNSQLIEINEQVFSHIKSYSCEEIDFLLNNNGNMRLWIDKFTKKCPNKECVHNIYKDGGCNSIICSVCKHNFCWICLKEWNVALNNCC